MRKLFFIFALLSVSLMSWATQYCGETITATDGVTTVELTCTNPTTDTYVVVITSSNENFQGLIGAGNYCYVNSEGNSLQILPTSDFVSFNSTTRTLTITLTSTNGYKPKFYNPFYLNFSGAQKEFTTIQNQTFEWPASCSDTRENSDLTRTSAESVTLDAAATSTITYTTSSTGAVTYSSSNPSVATVNSSGVITAVRYGEATITVSQEADASYKAGSFTVDVAVNMGKKASTMGYGSLILEDVNLYDWNGNFAGNNACGVADVYVVTYGDKLVYKAVIKGDKTFESCESYFCQIRTWKEDLTEMKEQWAKTCSGDLKTRYLLPEQTSNAPGLISAYGDVIKLSSYMVVSGCGARTMETVTYTRDYVNNCDFSDETAPVLGAATVTAGVDDITVSFDAVTSEEVFYMIEDAEHNQQFASMEPTFVLPKDGSGITYNFSCYAIDYNGNVSAAQTAVVEMPFVASSNLALNKSVVAGYIPGNADEIPLKANDGKDNTAWVTYGNDNVANDWWYVDLNAAYNITNITALWGDLYSTNYILQVRVLAPGEEDKANDGAWTTIASVTDATGNAEKSTDVTAVGRYVRIHSLARSGGFFRLREFKVYGSGLADVDTQKPNMISASFVSSTDTRIVIAVEAEDDKGVDTYHVVDAGNSIDELLVAEAGQITVSGLTAGTDYNFTITAKDLFGNESANSKTVAASTSSHLTAPNAAATAPTWPADQVKAIYSPTYSADCNFANWGGCVAYTNDTYGKKYVMGAECWGFGLDGYTLNCLTMEKLHADIWIADDASLRLVPIYGGAGLTTDDSHGKFVNLKGQQWNSIDLTLSSDFAGLDLSSIFQFKVDNANGLTIWIGNLYFYRESAIVDGQAPTNVSASVAARGFNSVKITARAEDNSGAVSFKVLNGESILATGSAATGVSTTITVSSLTPGTNYNLNVIAYDEAGNEASPVAVATSTKALPSPAPTPNLSNKNVVLVFTDAMAGGKTDIHSGGWGETTQVEWLDIAEGDKVFYGQNFNFAGWHSWGADIDATNMVYLHVDVYSLGMTSVNVTPISHDPTHEGSATISLTPDAWTSADIALSAYSAANLEWNKIFQFKFMNPVGGDELLIDNVYFWQQTTQTTPVMGGDAATGGWATFASPVKVAVPSGLTAYKATYSNEGGDEQLVLDAVSGAIPANEGVLLRGEADHVYTFSPTNDAAGDYTGNALVGCPVRTDITSVAATNDIFCLRYSDIFQITGFYLYSGQYIAAGKAYLPLPKAAPSSAPRRIRFVIKDNQTTTDINHTNAEAVPTTKFIENGQLYIRRGDAVYTIQGVRVK